jgi:hypothetical protein
MDQFEAFSAHREKCVTDGVCTNCGDPISAQYRAQVADISAAYGDGSKPIAGDLAYCGRECFGASNKRLMAEQIALEKRLIAERTALQKANQV